MHLKGKRYELDLETIYKPFFVEKMCQEWIDVDSPRAFVYLINDGEYIKIGVASDVATRLSDLQVGNPKKLTVEAVIPAKDKQSAKKIEQKLHFAYSRFRKCGEWFAILDVLDMDAWKSFWPSDEYLADKHNLGEDSE